MVPIGDGSYASNCLLARKLAEKDALCSSLSSWMGSPWWTGKIHGHLLWTDGQTNLGSDSGPQTTGHARRYPCNLGWRIWTHSDVEGKGDIGRDHHIKGFSMWMAGGGRKGVSDMVRPMNSDIMRRRTRFMFTTCTPPCSIYSALITSSSP